MKNLESKPKCVVCGREFIYKTVYDSKGKGHRIHNHKCNEKTIKNIESKRKNIKEKEEPRTFHDKMEEYEEMTDDQSS